jgi:rod shape determining protein RodA
MPHEKTTSVQSTWADLRRGAERLDGPLLGAVGLLVVLGLCFIASASRTLPGSGGESAGFLARQVVFLGLGIVALLALQKLDYLTLLRESPLLYLVGLLLLCAVLFTAPINGARSWFNLYFFKLQPSEVMKPVLILTLAYYLMYRDSYKRLGGLCVPLVLWFVPLALILKQPDLGTALALVPVVFAMLYAAGARLWHLGLMMLAGGGGLVGLWFTVMKDYQKRRILAWLEPEQYRLNEAWQQLHSEMAVGSGGFLGKGWGQSGHDGVALLPERHTDFIFAVTAEEGGFVIGALGLALLAFVALASLNVALRTREPAGRLIAVGVATLLGGQALINTGVALGLLPTTGLTLPFVSYGGSSLLSAFLCLGLLMNVNARRELVLAREDFA